MKIISEVPEVVYSVRGVRSKASEVGTMNRLRSSSANAMRASAAPLRPHLEHLIAKPLSVARPRSLLRTALSQRPWLGTPARHLTGSMPTCSSEPRLPISNPLHIPLPGCSAGRSSAQHSGLDVHRAPRAGWKHSACSRPRLHVRRAKLLWREWRVWRSRLQEW